MIIKYAKNIPRDVSVTDRPFNIFSMRTNNLMDKQLFPFKVNCGKIFS